MNSFNKRKFIVVASMTTALLGACASAYFLEDKPSVKPFPTPEKLQQQEGREVYVLPDGTDKNKVVGYCTLIVSRPSKEAQRLGENNLEDVCSSDIPHDLDPNAYSSDELISLCKGAEGTIAVVAAENGDGFDADNARFACLTDKPIP